jgi:hypothetical protein
MGPLEDAREQLLYLIELELCRIHYSNSDAPKELQEFYDYVEALPISNLLFQWYLMNKGEISIEFIDGAVQVRKIKDDEGSEGMGNEGIEDVIWDVFENKN